jgi:Family of unknown function (DUF6496)
MSCTYCKEFDFSKTAGDMSKAKQAFAKGGPVTEKATGEKYPSREAMIKHESKETPRMQREELVERSKVVAPARKGVPVAPREPLIALKKGGPAKIPKVMTEFKEGKLHSGGKEGPVVKNPKQAIAIAMSESRQKR